MPQAADRSPADGRDADGTIWFTIPQAAAFLDCSRQTIYSWERRGHLANPRHDEAGRRIYTQQQIANAHRAARLNARAVQRSAAA
jgi:DNA-binding transcriptional MerR regulator